ncbi:MAG: SDR family NAD(P)-dependent oxidoreductase [Chloroflexi bacterium]|nr:SDR family NAD(P)-dependent oxidoreductase [Chloroflexota bacterium]
MNKTAVITGAGQGTGRAIALRFAQAGMHCHLVGRRESKLRGVADEISELGGGASIHALDVTDDAAVADLGRALGECAVDILVNCAGDWLIASMDETGNEQLDHILRVNLRGPYILSRTLLPNLRRSDNASIINIGSLVTAISAPMVSAYTAAKVGLKGMTSSLAAELKPDRIRVVMISPGPADTPMRAAASPGIDKSVLVQPETIAEMAHAVVTLPRGITTSDFVLYSMSWE